MYLEQNIKQILGQNIALVTLADPKTLLTTAYTSDGTHGGGRGADLAKNYRSRFKDKVLSAIKSLEPEVEISSKFLQFIEFLLS